MIKRVLQTGIESRLFMGKVIILIGARQVGKSTLMKQIINERSEKTLELNCDEPEVRNFLSHANAQDIKQLIADNRILYIDEAQRVNGIGMVLKRIADNHPDVQLLVTGSSSFELQQELNEPLTGRKLEYHLYPISTSELIETQGIIATKAQLEARLIYGSYPDILQHTENARELLMNLSGSYLYQDVLALEAVRRPALLDKILQALALQVGSEVSYHELAQTVGTDNKTVEKYIDLLEKCYVIFRLGALNRNLRNEIKKGKKIYFYDNGIRNAVIQNFAPVGLRSDMGALWENFIISERIKLCHYRQRYAKPYFWRTTSQSEIDYVEEADGTFSVFEMKWNPRRGTTKIPKAFSNAYPVSSSTIVTPEKYIEVCR